jgi:hypothetical protein
MIENIEEFCTEFDVGAFRNAGPLDHAEIEVPEARTAYGSEMQGTNGARQGMSEERGICTSISANQPRVDDQRTTGDGIEENTHAVLQFLETQAGRDGMLA